MPYAIIINHVETWIFFFLFLLLLLKLTAALNRHWHTHTHTITITIRMFLVMRAFTHFLPFNNLHFDYIFTSFVSISTELLFLFVVRIFFSSFSWTYFAVFKVKYRKMFIKEKYVCCLELCHAFGHNSVLEAHDNVKCKCIN